MGIEKLIIKKLRTACALLAVLTSIGATAADSESMQIGFGKDRSVTFLSVKDRGTGGSALYLPEATMGT